MKNNNAAIVRRITRRTLRSDKRRNFFIVAAIVLTTFMIASVLSIGVSYYESFNMQEKRTLGSVSHMAFSEPTDEQLDKIYTLDYVEAVGLGAYIAQTKDFPKLNNLNITYIDKTQWEEIIGPTLTNILGHYPEQENEIMLSRYILERMGIDDPKIGMEIPMTFTVLDTDEVVTKPFILSCIYTEYASVVGGDFFAIYASPILAERYGKTAADNIMVNVIFKDVKHVSENVERLIGDLAFFENQPHVVSPAFADDYGNITIYIAVLVIIAFLMLTGYLLIYNVMYISISKDVRFYGMLKTLGTTPRQIRCIVVGQILRLCMIGLPIGCAASAMVSLLIVPAILSTSGFDTGAVVSFSPAIFSGALLFAVITALTGAITPAKKAANISPIETLKFTGEEIRTSNVRSSANGKPYKMAIRNIFRDRKRAAIVMLSLFLGITVFTTIMTVAASMDIDHRVDTEYKYDFSLDPLSIKSFQDETVKQVKDLPGIDEISAITLEPAELEYSETLDKYIGWLCNEYDCDRATAIKKYLGFGLKGIDRLALRELNKTLPTPIDEEAFERGEIALINIFEPQVKDCFTGISTIDAKCGENDAPFQIPVGGIISEGFGSILYAGGMEIWVSNTFLQRYIPEPQIVHMDMNVINGQDEQVYNALDSILNPSEVKMESRYEGRKSMEDAKTIMFVLGGGISAVLGFIGIFNFINVMSVGIMVRRREFATLESIGMGKKQMRSMLRSEGIGYAVISIVCSMTLGNGIAFGLYLLFKNVESSAQFTYPLVPAVLMCAVISLICLITPELVYKGVSKLTLVERLREAE